MFRPVSPQNIPFCRRAFPLEISFLVPLPHSSAPAFDGELGKSTQSSPSNESPQPFSTLSASSVFGRGSAHEAAWGSLLRGVKGYSSPGLHHTSLGDHVSRRVLARLMPAMCEIAGVKMAPVIGTRGYWDGEVEPNLTFALDKNTPIQRAHLLSDLTAVVAGQENVMVNQALLNGERGNSICHEILDLSPQMPLRSSSPHSSRARFLQSVQANHQTAQGRFEVGHPLRPPSVDGVEEEDFDFKGATLAQSFLGPGRVGRGRWVPSSRIVLNNGVRSNGYHTEIIDDALEKFNAQTGQNNKRFSYAANAYFNNFGNGAQHPAKIVESLLKNGHGEAVKNALQFAKNQYSSILAEAFRPHSPFLSDEILDRDNVFQHEMWGKLGPIWKNTTSSNATSFAVNPSRRSNFPLKKPLQSLIIQAQSALIDRANDQKERILPLGGES